VAPHLEQHEDRPLLHGGLLRLCVHRQVDDELLVVGVLLLIALRWS
jgi:hypothetical protein